MDDFERIEKIEKLEKDVKKFRETILDTVRPIFEPICDWLAKVLGGKHD